MEYFWNSSFWWTYVVPALTVLYVIILIRVFFTILLENRNPLKTQSYLLLLVLLPVIGLIVYFFFGVNYRKEKLFSRKKISDNKLIKKWREEYEEVFNMYSEEIKEVLHDKIKIPRLNYRNEHSVLTAYNEVEILINGEEKFPKLLEDLNSAKHHIHLEYYIFLDDSIGNQIIDVLIQKKKEGVDVRLILDAVGSFKISNHALRRMEKGGIEFFDYMSVRIPQFANKINYRDHRKIVVIDGEIGYLGGINVDERYINGNPDQLYWRDTHMRVEGDAVQTIQLLFILNWYFVSGQLLEPDEKFFPSNTVENFSMLSILGSGPDSDSKSMMELYFAMIANAQNTIQIATPYFIPNESILTALCVASKSGVEVELMLPGKSDTKIAQRATFSYAKTLLEAGVKIWIYEKGMIHSKTIVVDNEMSTLGTANMDYRSFEQNAEINAIIFDHKVAERMHMDYENDKASCKLYTFEDWKNRSFKEKLLGSISRLFSPLL